MSRKLIVKPDAENDILDAFLWYEERQQGLGVRFFEELDSVLNRIVINPRSCQEVEPDIRWSLTRTFPYLVFYNFDDDAIYVLAVIHAAQDPRYIAARLGV